MIIDIYTHIFPERFFQELERGSPKLGNMGKRLRSIPKLFNLDLRFKDMDAIGKDYRQIISLPNPPLEDIAEGVYFFASDLSNKSTGNFLNVDAGNAASFTR